MSNEVSLKTKEKVAYGIGAIGKDWVYALVSGFLLIYFNTVIGVSGVFTGVLFMVARVFDAFNDPFMGVIVEKTRTKMGKFRPWLLIGTLLNAVVLYAMFAVPEGLTTGQTKVYISVAYILWGMTYTIMDIPYWSMIPAITKSGKDRENISVIARSCAGVGAAIATALTALLIGVFGGGNERLGYKLYAGMVAVFFVVTILITVFNVREKVLDNNITGKKVAYVGDGINDSPVLARADIGISMGGIGSNSAIEASDMVIMTDELKKIIEAIQISKKTNRIIKENLIFSIGVKILILLLSILGIADMWEAVFADVGTTLITIFNTIRILK